MRIIKLLIILAMSWMTSAATFGDYSRVDVGGDMLNAFKTFGNRILRRRSTNQEKRDTSLSYSATNINNKEGTQVKTITVIKNTNDNSQKLKINPDLHKNENWGQEFRENFDSYGVIPDVPDVDDLFEYVNRKHNNDNSDKNEKKETKKEEKKAKEEKKVKEQTTPKPKPKTTAAPKEKEKPVTEMSAEASGEIKEQLKPVEKIKGDAELLPNFNSSRLKVRESRSNFNYSTPKHSVHQYFENYVQLSQGGKDFGYDYQKPCVHAQPIGSVTIATPAGKTYNIPSKNNTYNNPYLAPAITRRPQIQQQQPQQTPPANGPVFPVNSLLPPLQQQGNNNNPSFNNFLTQQQQQQNSAGGTQQLQPPNNSLQPPNFQTNQQQQPQQQPQNSQGQNTFVSTSQRPYVAPNIRSGLSGVSRGPTATSNNNYNGYQNGQNGYRINTFNTGGFRKPNLFRSRGLKY